MHPLQEMIARTAQPGRVAWIGCRPGRREPVRAADAVWLDADGVRGDHARPGKRAVTLMQAEHLAAIGSYLGRGPVDAAVLRRNLVIAGLNLAGMRGRQMQVGDAVIAVTVPCAPCSRMEEALAHSGYAAVRGHGGWCAAIVQPGRVRVGDAVIALQGS